MRKRIQKLKKQGSVRVEMIVGHMLPFDHKTYLCEGKTYYVDPITAAYLTNGFYAKEVG